MNNCALNSSSSPDASSSFPSAACRRFCSLVNASTRSLVEGVGRADCAALRFGVDLRELRKEESRFWIVAGEVRGEGGRSSKGTLWSVGSRSVSFGLP